MPPRDGARQAAEAAAKVNPTQASDRAQNRSRPARPKGVAEQATMSLVCASRSPSAQPIASSPNPGTHFRSLANKLFMGNKFSGTLTQQLCQYAASAGAAGVRYLGRAGAAGSQAGMHSGI